MNFLSSKNVKTFNGWAKIMREYYSIFICIRKMNKSPWVWNHSRASKWWHWNVFFLLLFFLIEADCKLQCSNIIVVYLMHKSTYSMFCCMLRCRRHWQTGSWSSRLRFCRNSLILRMPLECCSLTYVSSHGPSLCEQWASTTSHCKCSCASVTIFQMEQFIEHLVEQHWTKYFFWKSKTFAYVFLLGIIFDTSGCDTTVSVLLLFFHSQELHNSNLVIS